VGWTSGTHGTRERCLQCFDWEARRKGAIGRRRRRWEDNTKMGLGEMRIDVANWIQLAQGRFRWRAFVDTVMNLRVP
jgi:hypothetical protein